MIPYLPSAAFYAAWIQGGNPPVERREIARTALRQPSGEIITLSVPVVGGAGALKSARGGGLLLSGHGDWRRVHIGALNACYSRAPYGEHLLPGLAGIIRTPFSTLAELNFAIHSYILAFLNNGDIPGELKTAVETSPLLSRRAAEIAAGIRPGLSVIDALARLGRETLLGLCALSN